MRKGLFIFLLLLCSFGSRAQLWDTIKTSFQSKPKFIFAFDTRNSFIRNNNAKIFGLKAGLEFGQCVRMGLGLYSLLTEYYRTEVVNEGSPDADTLRLLLNFGYVSPFVEYVFFYNRKWEFSVPLNIGFGSIRLDYTDSTGRLATFSSRGISLLELSVVGHYKFFNWIGLGAGVGYRQLLTNDKLINRAFSSPIYIFKLKLFLGPIFRAVFPKKDKGKPEQRE